MNPKQRLIGWLVMSSLVFSFVGTNFLFGHSFLASLKFIVFLADVYWVKQAYRDWKNGDSQ